MKNTIITILVALLSFSAVSVYADRPTGDPLGVKILEKYMSNHESKYKGMTMQLTDDEVKEFKAGKYRAKYEHSAAWDVVYLVEPRGIEVRERENSADNPRSDERCAPMKLYGNELKVQMQFPEHHFAICR